MLKRNKSVVIASDQPGIVDQICNTLSHYNYSIAVENSVIKSILKALEPEINLMILDINETQDSGIDMIKIIKQLRPRLPVVVLSGDNSIQSLRAFVEAGVFYCVLKPINNSEIEKVLDAVQRLHQKQEKSQFFSN